MLIMALMLLLAGCGQKKDNGPEAVKLRKDLKKILDVLGGKAEPLLVAGNVEGLDHLIQEKFATAAKAGKPLAYGLAVLSSEGKLVTGRFPARDGGPNRKARKGINFGQYDSFKKVLSGKSAGSMLYTPQGTMYSVCKPLRGGRKVIGMICVGYPEDEFKRKFKMDQERFLDMNFD